MVFKVECKFLKAGKCVSIAESEEAKEARKTDCKSNNKQSCCYLCSNYEGCEISCTFLGEKEKMRCPLCNSKMFHSEMNLRAGGWSGAMKGLPLGIGEFGEIAEELLPVIVYVCPNCGKLEFIAKEKTKQKIINRS
jgi:hypothetical protein